MRLYAYTYPQDVAGIVLVDSSHEDDPTARQAIMFGQPDLVIAAIKQVVTG